MLQLPAFALAPVLCGAEVRFLAGDGRIACAGGRWAMSRGNPAWPSNSGWVGRCWRGGGSCLAAPTDLGSWFMHSSTQPGWWIASPLRGTAELPQRPATCAALGHLPNGDAAVGTVGFVWRGCICYGSSSGGPSRGPYFRLTRPAFICTCRACAWECWQQTSWGSSGAAVVLSSSVSHTTTPSRALLVA